MSDVAMIQQNAVMEINGLKKNNKFPLIALALLVLQMPFRPLNHRISVMYDFSLTAGSGGLNFYLFLRF